MGRTRRWLVMYWYNKMPKVSFFDEEMAACAFAQVRNAVVMEYTGTISKAVDYWRRDDDGNPMPFEIVDVYGGAEGIRFQ